MIVNSGQPENRSTDHPGNHGKMPEYLRQGLARWGPATTPLGTPGSRDACPVAALDLTSASRYCEELCRQHYENFTVASRLVPASLRRHFCHVYAYCRWADDLADEMHDTQQSLALLDWWERQLDDCYHGTAGHPVFVALRETIREFDIPRDPFANLLLAFRRDQRQTRYESWEDLMEYCRGSADPVGRLVLHLGRCYDEQLVAWSDSICSGLQIANFCQDVAGDWARGRIYLPRPLWQRVGYDERDFAGGVYDERFRAMMAEAVAEAERLLRAGWPLVRRVPRQLRFQLQLFVRGGLAIVQAIRRQRYDVWRQRPTVSRRKKVWLAIQSRCSSLWPGQSGSP